jgi:methionyl-tRNA formyltransferase
MRIAFMGTPDFAVPTLDALHSAGHEIACVYSQPPRPAGRGKAATPGAVHRHAFELGLPVRHPATLRDEGDRAAFAALDLDAAVVAAYGLILPEAVLSAPRLGCFNVHASLLPRWRGAAPVQRAILAGDEVTGITIMAMERGLDTGPMLAKAEARVDGKTTGALTTELAQLGAALMAEVLARPEGFVALPQPDAGVTYADKIAKAEARLDFAAPAEAVERRIRAFAPAPGAFFEHGGERIQLLAALVDEDAEGEPGRVLDDRLTIACSRCAIRPLMVKRAGRAAMATPDLLRGFPIPKGTHLPS